MNEKRKIPLIAALIPLLLLFGAVYLVVTVVTWLFSGKKIAVANPATAPANTEPENRRKEAETTYKNHTFRQIPAEIPAKPAVVPIYSAPALVFPPVNIPALVAKPVIKTSEQTMPPPIKKNFVTRKTLASVFDHGSRKLTLTAAVAALKNLGFGKTAAYAALTPDGKFSAWLQFASDGIITWRE